MKAIILATAAFWPAGAIAQTTSADPDGAGETRAAAPFTGSYAGVELGGHEHHFYLNVTNLQTGRITSRYYRGWGFGGGAFVGHEFLVKPRVRVGVEAGISLGGNNPVAHLPDGTFYTQHPRYGYRATGRVGYLLRENLMVYGTFGYGGHNYRLEGSAHVQDAHEWGSSFTVGAGVQYRLTENVGIRLDFRHLDNQMSHLLIGLPIRF